jgi:hypothetical protein
VSPKADEKRYLVSGYGGQLSARGETILLHDHLGNLIDSETYVGSETPSQQYLRITELLYAPVGPDGRRACKHTNVERIGFRIH